jgi:soluble lytic murein transglycosylase-like protein
LPRWWPRDSTALGEVDLATGGKVGAGAKGTTGKRAKPRKAPARKKSPRKRGKSRQLASSGVFPPRFYRIIEILIGGGLAAAASLAVLARLAGSVSPLALLASLAGVTVLGTIVVLLLEKIRHRASRRWRDVLNFGALLGLSALVWVAPPTQALDALREVLAGERMTQVRVVRHQVFAAYRRMDLDGQAMILERSRVFAPTVREAAAAFGEDPEILMGVAATESSFHPRPSRDGGRGLFQITAVPQDAEDLAREKLGVARLDPLNQRHNAFVAAATLSKYREQMNGDLFLTLLAYNIGPYNGGLKFIMETYGAANFAQAQPYLKELPRDYPVRVLAAALAYRVWTNLGTLPRYEEGSRAQQIQALGIPGLDEPSLLDGWISDAVPDR